MIFNFWQKYRSIISSVRVVIVYFWFTLGYASNNSDPPESNNKYHPYFSIGGARYFHQSSKVATVYDLFLPLYQQKNNRILFIDLRIFDRRNFSYEGNFHLGFRKLYPDVNRMLGIYTAFDHKACDSGNTFSQLTFGFEWWQNCWFVGGNIYYPVGNAKKLIAKREMIIGRIITTTNTILITEIKKSVEEILPGIDGEIGYAITDSLTAYFGGYYFKREKGDVLYGRKFELNYDYKKINGKILGFFDGATIEIGMQHDKSRGMSAFIGIKLKIGLNGLTKNCHVNGFERHLVQLVRRDPDIVVAAVNTETEFDLKKISHKDDNNLNFRVAAEASLLVYPEYAKELQKLIIYTNQSQVKIEDDKFGSLTGYSVFDFVANPDGFYALVLRKLINSGSNEFLIAIRGTELLDPKDLLNDLQLVIGKIPDQYKSAENFITKLLAKVGLNNKIVITGHSLGGVLSELISAKFGIDTVAFESFGAKKLIAKLVGNKFHSEKITIINVYPNIINTFGEQVNLPLEINNGGKVCLGAYCSVAGVFSHGFLNSHHMAGMLRGIKKDGTLIFALRENKGRFSVTRKMYNATPEIYDQQMYQLWQAKYSYNFFCDPLGMFGLSLREVFFRIKYPTFESYKKYVVNHLTESY